MSAWTASELVMAALKAAHILEATVTPDDAVKTPAAMIEQIARAIQNESFAPDQHGISERSAMRYARAAVTAMREPTEAMHAAGFKHAYAAAEAWQAMIAAVLEGK